MIMQCKTNDRMKHIVCCFLAEKYFLCRSFKNFSRFWPFSVTIPLGRCVHPLSETSRKRCPLHQGNLSLFRCAHHMQNSDPMHSLQTKREPGKLQPQFSQGLFHIVSPSPFFT